MKSASIEQMNPSEPLMKLQDFMGHSFGTAIPRSGLPVQLHCIHLLAVQNFERSAESLRVIL
jgi:hypothetical protein